MKNRIKMECSDCHRLFDELEIALNHGKCNVCITLQLNREHDEENANEIKEEQDKELLLADEKYNEENDGGIYE